MRRSLWLSWWRRKWAYETVPAVWLERSATEFLAYGAGQSALFIVPVLLSWIGRGDRRGWYLFVSVCAALFAAFTLLTLVLPVGSRRRYQWLSPHVDVNHERLCLGQMDIRLLLSAKARGAEACLYELLLYVFLIALVAAAAQASLWLYLGGQAITFPTQQGGKPVAVGPFDFVYWSAVTMSTTGFGEIIR